MFVNVMLESQDQEERPHFDAFKKARLPSSNMIGTFHLTRWECFIRLLCLKNNDNISFFLRKAVGGFYLVSVEFFNKRF